MEEYPHVRLATHRARLSGCENVRWFQISHSSQMFLLRNNIIRHKHIKLDNNFILYCFVWKSYLLSKRFQFSLHLNATSQKPVDHRKSWLPSTILYICVFSPQDASLWHLCMEFIEYFLPPGECPCWSLDDLCLSLTLTHTCMELVAWVSYPVHVTSGAEFRLTG